MKAAIFAVMTCSLLVLAGCSGQHIENPSYSTAIDGQNVVITFSELGFSEGKIEAEENTYTFAYANDGSLAITYPDGYIYTQMEINGGIASTGDYDSDAMKKKGYIDGMSLARAISSAADGQRTQRQEGAPLIMSLLLLAAGAWMIIMPKAAWWISKGWWYRNAEPSDLALMFYRAGGCILVFAGLISLFA